MKERPILFSAPMVRAILDGRKTQTRRVVKNLRNGHWQFQHEPEFQVLGVTPEGLARCPYGKPGDRLWVRETRGIFPENGFVGFKGPATDSPAGHLLHYKADDGDILAGPWRPSIHMPRVASRILLEVVSVRVERLQDISEVDAKAEGIALHEVAGLYHDYLNTGQGCQPIASFASLWESINGAGSWNANPWVWVVEFKRMTPIVP